VSKKEERSPYTVGATKWHDQDFAKIRAEIEGVEKATDALEEVTSTARAELRDLFMLLYQADPPFKPEEQIRDDHLVDLAVNTQVPEVPQYKENRRFTRGDKVAAGMALQIIEPELEPLFDAAKLHQQQADELQKLRDKLEDLLNELAQQMSGQGQQGEGSGSGEGQQGEGQQSGQGQGPGGSENLQDEIDNLKKMIEAMEQALKDGLAKDAQSMQAALAAALEQSADQARGEAMASRAWGLDRGQLLRMPAKDRLDMAKRLNQNPELRAQAEEFGRLKALAMSSKTKVVDGVPHEFVGVELGNDLAHLLPSELARMDDVDQEWLWLSDYAEGRLLQYKLQGTEKIGRGGIVYCPDSSASMRGQRDIWAKALGLVLLSIAKEDDREVHVVHFASKGQLLEQSFTKPADFKLENILEFAESFLNGGTDFVSPLDRAIEILEEEHARTGRTESDIIFATDGQAGVTDEWVEQFHKRLEAIDGDCVGIAIGAEPETEPLNSICRGQVLSFAELSSKNTRKGLAHVFQRLQK
jgi:uncharacterized protein with von Willebrand factor type A (vWA) domain